MAVAKNLKRIVPDCGKGLNGIAHANADFPHASHRVLTGLLHRPRVLVSSARSAPALASPQR